MRRRRHLWWWFLVPLGTLGFGTFAIVLYAGARLRSRLTMLSSLGYLGVIAWSVIDLSSEAPVGISIAVCMLGGTAHTLYLSHRFSRQLAGYDDPSVAAAQTVIAKRRAARRILEQDPALAIELRIGRPDLDRTYDDGGLIDVNHVPASTLVAELEMDPALAVEVIGVRDIRSGFGSADDVLIACASLNPDGLDLIRDRLLFLPRDTGLRQLS